MVVVPSAMSGETNRLLGLASELAPGSAKTAYYRELDMLASTGEQASSALLAIALQAEGVEAISFSGWQVPVRTDSSFTKARIESIDDKRVRAELDAGRVVIITGFQGIDPNGHVTTLGRGGSDTSAVAVAAALKAAECLIYTDVDGVYTTDPRVVQAAKRLNTVSFEEMLEMASLGSKVLQIRSVEFAGKYKVPMRVLSSFTPWDIDLEEESTSGTLITFEEDEKWKRPSYPASHSTAAKPRSPFSACPTPPASPTASWVRWLMPTSKSSDHPEHQQGKTCYNARLC
ncbi:Zinc finger MIZ domain-containing protein 1 [Manis javanica]|nr:Zinc finger MIZ domain-containing protein 1 [Manis javanica]